MNSHLVPCLSYFKKKADKCHLMGKSDSEHKGSHAVLSKGRMFCRLPGPLLWAQDQSSEPTGMMGICPLRSAVGQRGCLLSDGHLWTKIEIFFLFLFSETQSYSVAKAGPKLIMQLS